MTPRIARATVLFAVAAAASAALLPARVLDAAAQPAAAKPEKDQEPGVPAGWKLGDGTLSARQVGDVVTVTASGNHSSGGWQARLDPLPQEIHPPIFVLGVKPPDGPSIQVITPFTVRAEFKSGSPVKSVTVNTAKGAVQVAVEQAKP